MCWRDQGLLFVNKGSKKTLKFIPHWWNCPWPEEQKFFGSFFQKTTACLRFSVTH
jgi:hypothetical protein